MTGKFVMIVGATPGFLGTVRCQIQAAPGVGGLTDTATVDFLDTVTYNFVKFVEA